MLRLERQKFFEFVPELIKFVYDILFPCLSPVQSHAQVSNCSLVRNWYIVNGDLWACLFSQSEACMCGFFSLILKPHLWNHFSIESRPRRRMDEAIIGLACDANSAVSSANVATIISVDTGKSAV